MDECIGVSASAEMIGEPGVSAETTAPWSGIRRQPQAPSADKKPRKPPFRRRLSDRKRNALVRAIRARQRRDRN